MRLASATARSYCASARRCAEAIACSICAIARVARAWCTSFKGLAMHLDRRDRRAAAAAPSTATSVLPSTGKSPSSSLSGNGNAGASAARTAFITRVVERVILRGTRRDAHGTNAPAPTSTRRTDAPTHLHSVVTPESASRFAATCARYSPRRSHIVDRRDLPARAACASAIVPPRRRTAAACGARTTVGPTEPSAMRTSSPRTPAIMIFEIACARRVPTLRHHWRAVDRRESRSATISSSGRRTLVR